MFYQYVYMIIVYFICNSICINAIEPYMFYINGKTMGTKYNISIKSKNNINNYELLLLKRHIDKKLNYINALMSTYMISSTISQFNYSNFNIFFIGKEISYIVRTSINLSKLSIGIFDITVGSLIDLWGFDKSDNKNIIPYINDIKYVNNLLYCDDLIINRRFLIKKDKNICINLSSIAKGYAVDIIYRLLRRNGFNNCLIEIGGEIRVSNINMLTAWKLGIYNPKKIDKHNAFVLNMMNSSLATSGTYLNYFEYNNKCYSHIINPFTKSPINKTLVSTSVISYNCMLSDVLSTIAMLLGELKFKKLIYFCFDMKFLFLYNLNIYNAILIHKGKEFPILFMQ